MNIKLVQSKHKYGCGIACLAMVTGKPYDEIADHFRRDFDKKGMPWPMYDEYCTDHGFSVLEKRLSSYKNVAWATEVMLKPFADVHIVNLRQFCDAKINHAVVMTADGDLLCPNGATDADLRSGTYFVQAVFGLYK